MSKPAPRAILGDLLRLAAVPGSAGEDDGPPVVFRGADPVLPVPFRIGELGAAAIAAAAVGDSSPWRLRDRERRGR